MVIKIRIPRSKTSKRFVYALHRLKWNILTIAEALEVELPKTPQCGICQNFITVEQIKEEVESYESVLIVVEGQLCHRGCIVMSERAELVRRTNIRIFPQRS